MDFFILKCYFSIIRGTFLFTSDHHFFFPSGLFYSSADISFYITDIRWIFFILKCYFSIIRGTFLFTSDHHFFFPSGLFYSSADISFYITDIRWIFSFLSVIFLLSEGLFSLLQIIISFSLADFSIHQRIFRFT